MRGNAAPTPPTAGRAARPLAILGPTASGKSQLALAMVELLAQQGQTAELVSIDSMQVYVGMGVGTAPPSLELAETSSQVR